MKKITMVLDGVADRPNDKLGGKTPLEYARTPNLDALFRKSKSGTVLTIPAGLEVGSAVANLGLLGFDPAKYRGRAVIEAAGLGMPIDGDDMYIRVNMVTFEGEGFENSRIVSYSAYDVPTAAARPVAESLAETYPEGFELRYCGSFRNILIVKGGRRHYPLEFMPAHDIIGRPVAPFIRRDGKEAPFFELMEKSYDFLRRSGTKINGVWFWGASIIPDISGDTAGRAVLSETLLMDGITAVAGLPNFGTEREGRSFRDFLGEKLENAIRVVREYDDVYVHIQETDDLSHELQPLEKAGAIEAVDALFLPAFLESIPGEYELKLASDHFTFSDTGAHGGEPVPFLFYRSAEERDGKGRFTEADCAAAGVCLTAKELRAL
jgi:2,3-bisphosphoglycerate-independent phosphoglycerate mutase